MASAAQYTETVYYRISKGKPQVPSGVWRAAIQSTLPTALQRLAERVAADETRYPLLMYDYSLHLSSLSEISLAAINASPTLSLHVVLLSPTAQTRWRLVRQSGVDNPPTVSQIERVKYRFDLDNPPPCPDFWYFIVGPGDEIDNGIVVRDSDGNPPGEVVVTLWANGVPLITDPVFDVYPSPGTGEGGGELFDDLIALGVELVLEAGIVTAGPAQAAGGSQ